MKNFATIYALTHCESYYNKLNLFTGRINSNLTPRGKKCAQEIAEKLKNKQIDIAFVSPLKRTKETLKPILKYHKDMKVVIENRLIERDYGILSRKNKDKYAREHPDVFPAYHRSFKTPPPKGESIEEVKKRVDDFLKDLLKLIKEKHLNVLIIAHSNSIRPIRKYFENLSLEEMLKLENQRNIIFEYKIDL